MPRLVAALRNVPVLRGLTTRGRAFLAAAVAAVVCAVLTGEPDLLRLAVLLAALPLVGCLLLLNAGKGLTATRTVTPMRVCPDEPIRVRLTLRNEGRSRSGLLLVDDRVPFDREAPKRCVIDALPAGAAAAVTYPLRAHARGRYRIGPLRVGVTDPFGMCRITRTLPTDDFIVVVPRVLPLGRLRAGGHWDSGGEGDRRSAAASGEDDVGVREYRRGDDLRRVHWRSTARRGDLMVRQDEEPRRRRATVLLDCREVAHEGTGPTSSFEWAVTAAASVASHLMKEGFGVRLVTDGTPAPWSDTQSHTAVGDVLDRLAVCATGSGHRLREALTVSERDPEDGLIVAILGDVTPDAARAVARLRRTRGQGVAVLVRSSEWGSYHPHQRRHLERQRAEAATLLRSSGWKVTDGGPDQSVAQVWSHVEDAPRLMSAR